VGLQVARAKLPVLKKLPVRSCFVALAQPSLKLLHQPVATIEPQNQLRDHLCGLGCRGTIGFRLSVRYCEEIDAITSWWSPACVYHLTPHTRDPAPACRVVSLGSTFRTVLLVWSGCPLVSRVLSFRPCRVYVALIILSPPPCILVYLSTADGVDFLWRTAWSSLVLVVVKSVSPLRNSEFYNVGWLLEVCIFVTCNRSVDVVDQGSCPRLGFAVLRPIDLLCRFWVLFFKPSLKGDSWEIF
jgi:hypothetical protein